jgi:two-component system KDP operon response regulator KdpE
MRILVVNPHELWAERVEARLKSAGARVWVAEDWTAGQRLLDEAWPDVVVIEARILERNASEVVPALRRGEWMPLLVPTTFGSLLADARHVSRRAEDTLHRLEMLVTRLQGAFESVEHQSIRVGKLTIDLARKEVVFAARRVPLPPNQFRLLVYLALNAGRVVEHGELVREVWGYAYANSDARELLKTHIRQIRRKLGWTEDSKSYLKSVRGFGYLLGSEPPGEDIDQAQ